MRGFPVSELQSIASAPTDVTDILRMPDSFPGIFHVTDIRGRITQVSDDWLAVLGYAREEVIGRKNVSFLTDDCAATSQTRMSALFEDGRVDNLINAFVTKSKSIVSLGCRPFDFGQFA